MKWRNTKERELLTSNSGNGNTTSNTNNNNNNNNTNFTDGTESTTSTKNSASNDKNELCILSNDCCDCSQQKEDTITFRPSLLINNNHPEDSNSSDVDIKNDTRRA